MKRLAALALLAPAACASAPSAAQQATLAQASRAPLSLAADDRMIVIPAGRFVAGSTPEERNAAQEDDAATAGDAAHPRDWFDREANRRAVELPAYRIDLMPVTQAQYAELVSAERVATPEIDEATWPPPGVTLDLATARTRFAWHDGHPPPGREDHPVVLVPWADAQRYCTWRGALRGERRRLPTADEFEKAARGDGGMLYPWGNLYEPDKLNSAVKGPGDTTPVGTYTDGASPYGVLDLAGNVLQWTATPGDGDAMVVKGSGWQSFAGMGRGASTDTRAKAGRYVLVGFRCAGDPPAS